MTRRDVPREVDGECPCRSALLAVVVLECQHRWQTMAQPGGPTAMPTYQYACTAPDCGNQFELVQSFTDPAASSCPVCGGPVRKVFSAVGVVFKGSGFYRNDSRAASSSSDTGSSSSSSSSSGSSSSSSSSEKSSTSDAKPTPPSSSSSSAASAAAASA